MHDVVGMITCGRGFSSGSDGSVENNRQIRVWKIIFFLNVFECLFAVIDGRCAIFFWRTDFIDWKYIGMYFGFIFSKFRYEYCY